MILLFLSTLATSAVVACPTSWSCTSPGGQILILVHRVFHEVLDRRRLCGTEGHSCCSHLLLMLPELAQLRQPITQLWPCVGTGRWRPNLQQFPATCQRTTQQSIRTRASSAHVPAHRQMHRYILVHICVGGPPPSPNMKEGPQMRRQKQAKPVSSLWTAEKITKTGLIDLHRYAQVMTDRTGETMRKREARSMLPSSKNSSLSSQVALNLSISISIRVL
jgi:hypothetical protein